MEASAITELVSVSAIMATQAIDASSKCPAMSKTVRAEVMVYVTKCLECVGVSSLTMGSCVIINMLALRSMEAVQMMESAITPQENVLAKILLSLEILARSGQIVTPLAVQTGVYVAPKVVASVGHLSPANFAI